MSLAAAAAAGGGDDGAAAELSAASLSQHAKAWTWTVILALQFVPDLLDIGQDLRS